MDSVWLQLGIALGLGLLVGLQREWVGDVGAGIRTFPLITVFGAVCALLAQDHGGWVIAGGLVALAGLLVVTNLNRRASGDPNPGPTTEIAALLMFAVGATLVVGHIAVAIAGGGLVVVLLQWKQPMHRFVSRIGEADLRAVFRLVLIGLVVLPAMPNRAYGPYDVLNPFHIWLMVVLIVGISLGGYLVSRLLGEKTGSIVAGILGGVISSTATSVSYARRTRRTPDASALAALVIMIASTIVFVRVSAEVAVTAPSILPHVLPQFVTMTVLMGTISATAYFLFGSRRPGGDSPEAQDPSELKAAVVFGVLYAAVLFGVAAAKEHFGDRGLYLVAALSGLTDMDAITLSTAQMMKVERVELDTGWRMMLLGALSNLVFKGAVVATLGHPRLLRRIAVLFGLSLAAGIGVLWLWPTVG
jgi:uncharacterized membrane protein (DUF4010 family)